MLGDFITRCLILLLGYAYPGFECYKTVENNRADNNELRFWCQYWIILAFFTVLENVADVVIGWLPLYGEMKLALFIYMWYPKTKGTGYVYNTLLRPYVSRHENDFEKKFQEWRVRAWDLAIFYWQNCTELGSTAFFQVFDYLAAQSKKFSGKNSSKKKDKGPTPSAPPLSSIREALFENNQNDLSNRKNKKGPSAPSIWYNISETPNSQTEHVHLDSQTEYLQELEAWEHEPDHSGSVKHKHNGLLARLRH